MTISTGKVNPRHDDSLLYRIRTSQCCQVKAWAQVLHPLLV